MFGKSAGKGTAAHHKNLLFSPFVYVLDVSSDLRSAIILSWQSLLVFTVMNFKQGLNRQMFDLCMSETILSFSWMKICQHVIPYFQS